MSKAIDPVLDYAIRKGASDIHISEGKPITFRIQGKLNIKHDSGIITKEMVEKYMRDLFLDNEKEIEQFLENKDIDFAYVHNDGTSFRTNAFFRLGKTSFVMRLIKGEVKSMEDLGLPQHTKIFTKMKQGLLLVTGPTGSGKSTTMVSILSEINNNRKEHILTVEDPIEYVFKDEKSVFSQREIGRDTKTFSAALRAAVREDPDVIMVGEMRDAETVKAALEMAETGHLVISTMHTSGSVQTITRLVNFFPPEIQNSIQDKIADNLVGVLSQRLIPTADEKGRTGIFELMFMTTGIKNLIRTGKLEQIQGNIETGTRNGMITMKKYADMKRDEGEILEKDYEMYFREDIV